MAAKLSPIGNYQFLLASGEPAVGGLLFTYVAGSVNTKQSSFTDSTGGVANPNPIVLNSLGLAPNGIWLGDSLFYKIVYAPSTDTDPPTSPIKVWDDIIGVVGTTSAVDQWVVGPAPTFVSATSFTLAGDQTSDFHPGRRVKTVNAGGTIYSTILTSTFGVLTTVTVANDSGVLDAGLSSVSFSLISAVDPSIDADMVHRKGSAVTSAATTNIWGIAGDYVHVTGNTGPITSLGTAPYAGAQRTVIIDSTPTFTNSASLILPGGADIVAAAGDRMIVRADTTVNMEVVDYIKANGKPVINIANTQPTRQVFTSGTAQTYTTPATATRIYVRMVGGGGGGGGAGTGGETNGGAGVNTTFSTLTASAGGLGTAGTVAATGDGGAGGAAAGGSVNLPGGAGQPAGGVQGGMGGAGGSSAFGGSGKGGVPPGNAGPGIAGSTNTGAGGGGCAGTGAAYFGAGGGGSGGYVEALILAPAANYTYTVGGGGAAGGAGTAGAAGGAGAAGIIIVDEWYD